ncbi:MAG: MDR family MFS transporter [Winkia neuii]|uniref:MFS transporter n=1 Tax=Winkia neuii TaxID=33007 RepID=A0A2I1IMK7_9ACTO|nr:MDR family MFS transporter [Winkia neuii]OFJ68572.1 hypothetical protein HMPREF2851_02050 [Actinomyces sp. HMSC064C12]OFK00553.1 hypothetical protein HMPREF2835_02955 [Actinomyces sp. HMSC072A03]OFT56745.1 hypothetical protein HMPREF3152_00645 [Actinomyces sp. HMSC06A08]KWZ75160.1 transporter, major facilitator family protein [Winkia neuii]MDK8099774.1 MDR family MFS transporter [Winkia neuii]
MGRILQRGRAPKNETMEVLVGLLLVMFVAVMSLTIVGTALPVMLSSLHGSETQYAWVVTSMLLSTTAATPIAGRLGDLYDKKKLLIFFIAIFAAGSLLAGISVNANMLIAMRVVQGAGLGSLMAMVQTVMAVITSPRERGRYNGYFGAVITVANVSGPIVGGFVVDLAGWRWCLWISVPFALLAMAVLAKKLHVPASVIKDPKVDYLGSTLGTAGVSLLLIYISMGGDQIMSWTATPMLVMVGLGVAAVVAFVFVELAAPQPIVPVRLLAKRTVALAVLASIGLGLVLNAPMVYFGQYFQIGRHMSPTASGMCMLPMMIASFVFSTLTGRRVSALGRWKRFVVSGFVMMVAGLAILSFTDKATPLVVLWVGMFLLGAGQGSSMQNLVLAVQNTVPLRDMGASTAMVTFFRNLGGAIGVQVASLVFNANLAIQLRRRFSEAGVKLPPEVASGHSMAAAGENPQVAHLIQDSFAEAMGAIFMVGTASTFICLILVALMRSSELRDTIEEPVSEQVAEVLREDQQRRRNQGE